MSLTVNVKGGNGESAIRLLKRRMQRELIYRKMKDSRFFEPPSITRVKKKKELSKKNSRLRRARANG